MQENVVIKYTRNTRINATIIMQENVVEKYTRNTRINATIVLMQLFLCKKMW